MTRGVWGCLDLGALRLITLIFSANQAVEAGTRDIGLGGWMQVTKAGETECVIVRALV